jgi:hypothetical protein
MKQSIGFSQFTDAFRDHGREDQFTYEGKRALFDFIEDMDQECDQETELDVIGLCCEFTEYSDLEEFQSVYATEDYPDIESVADATLLISVGNGGDAFIIQQF